MQRLTWEGRLVLSHNTAEISKPSKLEVVVPLQSARTQVPFIRLLSNPHPGCHCGSQWSKLVYTHLHSNPWEWKKKKWEWELNHIYFKDVMVAGKVHRPLLLTSHRWEVGHRSDVATRRLRIVVFCRSAMCPIDTWEGVPIKEKNGYWEAVSSLHHSGQGWMEGWTFCYFQAMNPVLIFPNPDRLWLGWLPRKCCVLTGMVASPGGAHFCLIKILTPGQMRLSSREVSLEHLFLN